MANVQAQAPKTVPTPATPDQGRVNAGQLSKQDFKFVQEAVGDAGTAVEIGQLALQKAKNKPVQDLARMIVTNHQKELQELRQLALKKGEAISTNASPEAIQLSQTLSRREDFDRGYLEQVIRDHRESQTLFRNAAANATDAEVKRFANDGLKLIEQHLSQARGLENSISTQKSGSSNLAAADFEFAEETFRRGLLQVRLAEQARGRAENQALRDFATRLAREHAKLNDELSALASKAGVTLSRELNLEQKEGVIRMAKLQGAEYQNQFLAFITKEHDADLTSFKRQNETGKDMGLREFARKSLPALEEHLRMARDLTASIARKPSEK